MSKVQKIKRKHWLLLFVLILVVLYSAIWYFASQFVQNALVSVLEQSKNKQNIIFCENINKVGYPLRVGVSCNSFSFRQSPVGMEISTQKIKATAPIYALKWADLAITSPASIYIPGLLPLSADWKELKLSGDIDKPVPDKITLMSENFNLVITSEAEKNHPFFSASFLRLDADGMNSNMSLRLIFDKVHLPIVLPKENSQMPAIGGIVRLQFNKAYQIFDDPPSGVDDIRERFRGHDGSVEHAEIKLESGGKVTISGPFSIDEEGYLNANFDLAIGDIAALSNSARQIFPSQGKNMDTIFFVINSMPKNQQGEPILKLTIKNGEVRLGYVKLGYIDPL